MFSAGNIIPIQMNGEKNQYFVVFLRGHCDEVLCQLENVWKHRSVGVVPSALERVLPDSESALFPIYSTCCRGRMILVQTTITCVHFRSLWRLKRQLLATHRIRSDRSTTTCRCAAAH